jgi:hypothetical protein
MPPVRVMSEAALERHLANLSSSPLLGTMFSFNGQTGIYHVIGDGTEVPVPAEFIGLLDLTRHGWIKFNEGEPPTIDDVGLSEDADLKAREELGDTDPSVWPIGLNGEQRDPWQEQFVVPLLDRGAGGEIFALVARGVVAMGSVRKLLGQWRWNPRRKDGLRPIVKVESGTYYSKRFNGNRPKPKLTIVDWVNHDGSSITAEQQHDEFNDSVPF